MIAKTATSQADLAPQIAKIEVVSFVDPLPKSKQRAAVTAPAGLFQTHEAPGAAPRVAFLRLEVIDPFSKIEPDHGVNRAMSLRLSFIAKRAQWCSGRIGRAACDDQRRQQAAIE